MIRLWLATVCGEIHHATGRLPILGWDCIFALRCKLKVSAGESNCRPAYEPPIVQPHSAFPQPKWPCYIVKWQSVSLSVCPLFLSRICPNSYLRHIDEKAHQFCESLANDILPPRRTWQRALSSNASTGQLFNFTKTVLSLLSIQVWISTRISRNLVTGQTIMAEKSSYSSELLEPTSLVDEGPCPQNFHWLLENSQQRCASFSTVPLELHCEIFRHLSPTELFLNVRPTSRRFKSAAVSVIREQLFGGSVCELELNPSCVMRVDHHRMVQCHSMKPTSHREDICIWAGDAEQYKEEWSRVDWYRREIELIPKPLWIWQKIYRQYCDHCTWWELFSGNPQTGSTGDWLEDICSEMHQGKWHLPI